MSISLFILLSTGGINGYKYQEGGLSNLIKYSTMSIATGSYIFTTVDNTKIVPSKPYMFFSRLVIIAPIITGFKFCIGHHMGKAIRYLEDN
jgi:hypothetical protein